MSGYHLATAAALIFTGIVCDRYGIMFSLLLGLLFATVPASALPWFSDNYSVLLASRLIQGFSVSFALVTVGPVTSIWFPRKEHGLAGGIMMSSMTLGLALGALLSPLFVKITGNWAIALALLSLLGWAAMVFALIVTIKSGSPLFARATLKQATDVSKASSIYDVIRSPLTWIGTLVLFFNTWSMQSFFALVPAYLATPVPMGIGLGSVVSGNIFFVVLICGMFSMIAGGLFLDRVAKGNYRIVMFFGFAITAAISWLIIMPGLHSSMVMLSICLIIAGTGSPFGASAFNAFAVTTFPRDVVGRAVGLMTSFAKFGSAAGIYVGGVLIARTGSFAYVIVMISVTALMAAVLTPLLKKGLFRRVVTEIKSESSQAR
jgi:MFS family permease